MKKRLLFVLALMVCGFASVWADEVTPEQAKEIALKFMKSHSSRRAAPAMEQPVKVSGLYVFNVSKNGGYVIVSNDDQTTPILGFSDSGSIDPDNMPSNMRAWLQGYADEIAWFQKNGITATPADKARRRAPTHSHDAINTLITTKWDQGRPYNLQCPLTNTYVIATGCLATAMAQVMYYTEKKAGNSTTATTDVIPGYNWTVNGKTYALQAIPENTEINWSVMKDTYTTNDNDESATAVATLMKCCGYSVKMNYGSSSSAHLSDADDALKNYFGYNETVTHYKRYNYTYSSWVDMIYNELSQGRPVLYAGQAVDGGHAFVCDGYQYDNVNSTDLFHINWGWSGQCDGLFVLSVLNPDQQGTGGSASNSAYTFGHEAIVGIQKASGTGTVLEPTPISSLNITIHNITLSPSSIALGESVNAIINVTNNSQTNNFDGEICLYNGDKKAVGKMFEIAPGATADCIITFTPTATGTYSINAKYPDANGTYHESGVSSVTLTVVDQTPINLTTSEIAPTTAIVGWTNVGGATSWNMRSRSATATIEDFNDFSDTYDSNGYTDNGWKRMKWSTDGNWRISANGGIGNSKCFISPSYENNTDLNPDVGLRTPKFALGGSFSCHAWGIGENFQVYISTNGINFTSISDVISATNVATQYTFDLAEYANQEGYIAIIHCNSSGHTSNSYLYIDNVSFTESVGEWTTTPGITTTSYTLTGLSAETGYEVQVQAVNNNGGKWSNPIIFTTLAYPVPENLTVSDVTPTSAKVSWTESDANSYDVRYAVRTEDYGSEATWLQYDNGTYKTNTGTGTSQDYTWGVMYPGGQVKGSKLTKVAFYENSYNSSDITVKIYSGGETAPDKLLYTQVVTPTSQGIHEITLTNPVAITIGENLWIILTEYGSYPMVQCTDNNEPNNTWRYTDHWYQTSGYGWMIRGYIEPENVNWSEPINFTEQPPYKLTGLEHSKNYAVQVRGNYGSAGYSDWATVTFDKASGNLELGNNNTNNAELIADWDGYHATAVTLTGRTLYKDGAWNTICLPFSLDATQLNNSPLANADIRELSKTIESNGKVTGFDNGTESLILNFSEAVTAIEAGKPYIVKWTSGSNITDPEFNNVTISKADASVTSNDGAITFIGSYDKQVFNDVNSSILLLGTKTQNDQVKSVLYYPENGASLGACRAYFQLADDYAASVPSQSVRSFVMNFGSNDNATGIISIGNSQLSTLNSQLSEWYTLDGRKLNGKPTAKGVYVKNGKKIVIK